LARSQLRPTRGPTLPRASSSFCSRAPAQPHGPTLFLSTAAQPSLPLHPFHVVALLRTESRVRRDPRARRSFPPLLHAYKKPRSPPGALDLVRRRVQSPRVFPHVFLSHAGGCLGHRLGTSLPSLLGTSTRDAKAMLGFPSISSPSWTSSPPPGAHGIKWSFLDIAALHRFTASTVHCFLPAVLRRPL
jgi:hypothetical protein